MIHYESSYNHAFTLGDIQTFFWPTPQHWFRINPTLALSTLQDPFTIYLQNHVPQFTRSTIVSSATQAHEIPPLLQITSWHLHLSDYIHDKDKIQGLQKLMTLSSLRNSSLLFLRLKEEVFRYMVIVRENARQSAIGIKRLLMECPRSDFNFLYQAFDIKIVLKFIEMLPIMIIGVFIQMR